MFATGLLQDKTVLITGGGSGLGAAMAARFAELGAQLVLVGRRLEALQATADALRAATRGAQVRVQALDIRSPDAVAEAMDRVCEAGTPNVLVNNAAASFIAQTEQLSARAADAILAPTLHGALYCTLALGKRWIDAGTPGVVLSILSTSTLTGRAFTVPSAMAKSGLLAMTRSLAVEWGVHGIRTVAIAPGPFPTEGATRQLNPSARGGQGERLAMNPLGRVGRPPELADLASYLISDGASYITGEMVVIDGGAHLRSSGAEDLLQWSPEQWAAHRATRG
ncbi:short-chain dehydrogenase [Comamonas serinivorans]|uniref:Peroxisomal trans-2-enoyl-CoA reductase n=1 Tax=Comamonas serinivorans TaxID=1082851 RepID=A0A1Y0EIU6_9BURK|nr:SDR family oxidoreductase [Comamonas serinivorans]ARU03289.1 short-chain dehydrogenase [Comamonas serinivorans]